MHCITLRSRSQPELYFSSLGRRELICRNNFLRKTWLAKCQNATKHLLLLGKMLDCNSYSTIWFSTHDFQRLTTSLQSHLAEIALTQADRSFLIHISKIKCFDSALFALSSAYMLSIYQRQIHCKLQLLFNFSTHTVLCSLALLPSSIERMILYNIQTSDKLELFLHLLLRTQKLQVCWLGACFIIDLLCYSIISKLQVGEFLFCWASLVLRPDKHCKANLNWMASTQSLFQRTSLSSLLACSYITRSLCISEENLWEVSRFLSVA